MRAGRSTSVNDRCPSGAHCFPFGCSGPIGCDCTCHAVDDAEGRSQSADEEGEMNAVSQRFPLCGPDAPEDRYQVACAGTPLNDWILSMGTYNCTGGSHRYGMHLVCSCTCHEVKTVNGLYALHNHSGHALCAEGCPAWVQP